MVDDTYKLALTMNIMKKQRERMVSDFSEKLDYEMMRGLLRFDHSAEFSIHAELYHVLWLDRHWNQLLETIDKEVQLEEDKLGLMQYFSKCFLELVESFNMKNEKYTPAFFEILRVKIVSLRDMIEIAQKSEHRCGELAFAQEKHKVEYQKMLETFLIKN